MKKIAVPSENISNRSLKKPSFRWMRLRCKAERSQLFFNQIFDKKRLKALISWVFKQSGEAEALRIIDLLKETGFRHATKAGISIGLHDLATPIQKAVLISESQLAIGTTERDFRGAKITATERSQRIIDTWHRASESLSKQVVDYFAIYDRFNPVYIMALSGARGNFSQVRQLIGMRGLMADQQGKIVNFPIQSNLREGLTLTEYFISCSGARKGLVDTALRTADTGYLTRRLVDVSHHVVVRKLRCNTNRSLAFSCLQSYNKVLLPLKERLVGRVLSEDIFISEDRSLLSRFYEAKSPFFLKEQSFNKNLACKGLVSLPQAKGVAASSKRKIEIDYKSSCVRRGERGLTCPYKAKRGLREPEQSEALYPPSGVGHVSARMGSRSPRFALFELLHAQPHRRGDQEKPASLGPWNNLLQSNGDTRRECNYGAKQSTRFALLGNAKQNLHIDQTAIAKQDQEISLKLALKIAKVREKVYLRSPLTCGFTHSVCQLCYGWSISQGSLVSLGDAVGVIAAQSIGEPGTQLTMRTFHTGGVFSGDLLQEIRAPHAGKIDFSKAFGGLLIRTTHGHLAFLSKSEGSLSITYEEPHKTNSRRTVISIPPFSLLFIRQGEKVSNNQLLAEFSIRTKEGAQPIKTQQTIFAELSGIIVEDCSGRVYTKKVKESALLLDSLDFQGSKKSKNRGLTLQSTYLDLPKVAYGAVSQNLPIINEDRYEEQLKENVKRGFKEPDFTNGVTLVPAFAMQKHRSNNNKNLSKFWSSNKVKRGHTNRRFVCPRLTLLQLSSICNKRLGKEKKAPFFFWSTSEKESQITVKSSGYKTKLCTTGVKPVGSSTCKAQIYTNEDIENDLFSYIEPVQSGRLGFLKILSTRIGATLDYSYPTKSIDLNLKKKYKIHNFRKDRYYTNLDFANSKLFHFYLSSNKASQIRFTSRKEVSLNGLQSFVLLGLSKSCKGSQMKNKDLTTKNKTLQFCLSKIESKYLHPESRKENRFLLQTIAEYGDIVDETYKKKRNRV